jgi:hypothetical protein
MTTIDFTTCIENYNIEQAQEGIALLKKRIDAVQTATYRPIIIKRVSDAILESDSDPDPNFVFDVLLYTRSPYNCDEPAYTTAEHLVCTLQIDNMKKMEFDITLDGDEFNCIINTNFMGNIVYIYDTCSNIKFFPNADYRSYVPKGKGYMVECMLCNCLEQELDAFSFIEEIDTEPDDKNLAFEAKAKVVFDNILGTDHKLFAKGIKGGFAIGNRLRQLGLALYDHRLTYIYVYDNYIAYDDVKLYADGAKAVTRNKDIKYPIGLFIFDNPDRDKQVMNGLLEAYGACFRLPITHSAKRRMPANLR